MKLKVLGSSSSGNCYILENDTEALIIEAGLPFKEVKKALDFNIRKIAGVVVSHCHLDHAKYVAEYEKAGIPVFKPYDETIACPLKIKYGRFFIQAFRLVHDVPCYGYYISEPSLSTLVYASDTEYIKYRFQGLNHIMVEANHSAELLNNAEAKYRHQITGHMSIDTACNFIKANKTSGLRNIILCHLSEENSDEKSFLAKAREIVDCPVCIAKKGLSVSLDLCPF